MSLNIKDPETDKLARQLAARTGETLTEAILQALRERLQRTAHRPGTDLQRDLATIRARCSKLPVLDTREPDEIIGYNHFGVPD